MKLLKIILVILVVASCSKSDDDMVPININNLEGYTSNRTLENGAVIACAASEQDTNAILVFFYPEAGATNIQVFETENSSVDSNDYSNYNKINIESEPFFNGYLGKYTVLRDQETWLIVTFELDGEVKISNPIRSKQISKTTVWNAAVTINPTAMPTFNWEANAVGDNAIYFQVVSNTENDLLSGTYTTENQFQYYNLSNVVLNVTTESPPELLSNEAYNFTLMDVSLDNWVNLVSQKAFIVQ